MVERIVVDFNWISNRLATGGFIISKEGLSLMKSNGITHIINCAADFNEQSLFTRDLSFEYLFVGVNDDFKPKSVDWFKSIIDFGLSALSKPGSKVYCHCAAGINRGPSGAYAILRAQGFTKEIAELLIKKNRPIAGIAYKDSADIAITKLGYE